MPATEQSSRWTLKRPAPRARGLLADKLQISPITAQLLINRNLGEVEVARSFLAAHFEDICDPAKMPDMKPAVERLLLAVQKRQQVIIYGDSDADGLAATALLTRMLKMLGCRTETFIPGRLTDGYGLSEETVDRIIFTKPDLVVTVDCGITSCAEATQLSKNGIDLIITDHHQPGENLPEALAIVTARRPDSTYPFPDLSGTGVAFKLAWGLAQALSPGRRVSEQCRDFLNEATALVALGTIADVCPLLGENRVLVRYGIKAIASSNRPGIKALTEIVLRRKYGKRQLTAKDVGWTIGPMINAAGRLGQPEVALNLLLADDAEQAAELVTELGRMNSRRRSLGRAIEKQAVEAALAEGDAPAIVLASDTWHGGVLGPTASKLSERFGRPTFLIAFDGDRGRGSGRAPGGSGLHKLLASCSEHLEAHGGHDGAAGLTVMRDKFESFKEAFLKTVADNLGANIQSAQEISIDAEVPLPQLTRQLVEEIDQMRPFGQGNPEPILATLGLTIAGLPRTMGSGRTIGFRVKGQNRSIRAVGLGMASKLLEIEQLGKDGRLDLIYELSSDIRSGEPEMLIKGFRAGS
jgi:single-stranded-DNA-specific exonuclease